MKFSLIIPTKDRNHILQKSVDCLKKVNHLSDLEIFIINDSEQPVNIDFSAFPVKVEVLRNPGKGVASARNFGISKATSDWLVFMDDDMMVQPGTFDRIINLEKDSCLNINWVYPDFILSRSDRSPFIRYLKKYRFDSMEGWSNDPAWDREKLFRVNGVNSAFLVINKDTLLRAGAYNAKFPFAGFEDHDLSERLAEAGVKMYVDPTNMIFHNEEDRMELENWLERKRRGAITRKVAVGLGYKNLELRYSFPKRIVYEISYGLRKSLLATLKHWPATGRFDASYFMLVNLLLGAYSYAGYTKDSR